MNNIVVIGILFVFAIVVARIAWNNKLKYSYTDAEIGDTKQENLKEFQQLTDAEVLAVDDSMHQAGRDVIKRNVGKRMRATSLSERKGAEFYVNEHKYNTKAYKAHMASKYGTN